MTNATKPDEEKEIETVTSADGTEIAYERSGSGPPLVLVHGAMFDRSIWEIGDVRSTLAEHTTVYAIDRRNHGDSASSDDCSPDAQIADVVAVVESIDDPVHLLGHSSGANYALWAALRTDDLASVIPHEPAAPPDGEVRAILKETMEKTIELIEKGQNEEALTMVVNDFAKATPDELTELRSSPVWDAHVDTFHQTLLPEAKVAGEFDWWDLTPFEELSTPTLLLVGSESPKKKHGRTTPRNDAERSTRYLGGIRTFCASRRPTPLHRRGAVLHQRSRLSDDFPTHDPCGAFELSET